jgi:hypothetical protein
MQKYCGPNNRILFIAKLAHGECQNKNHLTIIEISVHK